MTKAPFRVSTPAAPHKSAEEQASAHPRIRVGPQKMTNPDQTLVTPAQAPEGSAHCHSTPIPWPEAQATQHPPLGTGRVNARPFKLRGEE